MSIHIITNKITNNVKLQLLMLLIIAFGLNMNTLFNDYAVDDEIVLTHNHFVAKGIQGFADIVSQPYFKGCDNVSTEGFSGGRYRPVALLVFALEYQLFGANPMVSHFINISLFLFLIALLFIILEKHVFRNQPLYLAFFSCLLFITHPIHTEVIANVKSRDELITYILLLGSLLAFIKNMETKKGWLMAIGLFCFFVALLTRESAVTFIGVLPLILYFFFDYSFKKMFLTILPLLIVFAGYLIIRYSVIGLTATQITGIENAPFLFASASQAFATKTVVLINYLSLLIFPSPLSWEYGYNQIPYVSIKSFGFMFSALLILFLACYAILTFKKKSIISFCILYFFTTISLVANFVVDIGTPLAERFLFQPSLAFCIILAFTYLQTRKKITLLSNILFIIILLLFSLKTVSRNGEWKNNETLYITDVQSSPNSLRANTAASNVYLSKGYYEQNVELRKSFLKKSIYYAQCAQKISSSNNRAHKYLMSAFTGLFNSYKTTELFLTDNSTILNNTEAKIFIKDLSNSLYMQGNGFYEQNKIEDAIHCYLQSIQLDDKNIEAWYSLGAIYYLKNDSIQGVQAWEQVKTLDPNHSFKKAELLLN